MYVFFVLDPMHGASAKYWGNWGGRENYTIYLIDL